MSDYSPAHTLLQARALQQQGRFAEALVLLQPALDERVLDVEGLVLAGVCAAQGNDLVRAQKCWQDALLIQPEHPVAHFNLGVLLRNLGLPRAGRSTLPARVGG